MQEVSEEQNALKSERESVAQKISILIQNVKICCEEI